MTSFSSTRTITAAKDHRCDQCMRLIHKGTVHTYGAGVYDADFIVTREHQDCRAVWLKLWGLRELRYDDTQDYLINDDLSWDKEWIWAEYPEVAERLWPSHVVQDPNPSNSVPASSSGALTDKPGSVLPPLSGTLSAVTL